MYFWRIEELKKRLKARPLTEREALPYLLIFLGLTIVGYMLPAESMNIWDYVSLVSVLVVTIAGTVYAYRCNGGTEGSHFLQRYFAIGWVLLLRWGVVVLPLFIVLMVVLNPTEGATWSWQAAVYFTAAEVVFYQRLGHHVRDVADPSLRSNLTVKPDPQNTAYHSP